MLTLGFTNPFPLNPYHAPLNPYLLPPRKPYDLGQFERFRRLVHTRPYATLLNHKSATTLSSLQVCAVVSP